MSVDEATMAAIDRYLAGQISRRQLARQLLLLDGEVHDESAADEQRLFAADIAAELNINRESWRTYVKRGRAPAADGYEGQRPFWYRSTIDRFIANRPSSAR